MRKQVEIMETETLRFYQHALERTSDASTAVSNFQFHVAFFVAVLVVAVELAVIRYVRHRYMDTPLLFQVIVRVNLQR